MLKRIVRVFVRRTSYTPDDEMCFVGEPPGLFIPPHDEVHISCVFTWDMDEAERLKFLWEGVTDKPVLLGGPAYKTPAVDFTPGMYTRNGIVFTSRGCNNNCSFCGVRSIEGTLVELPIHPGNIIQDNNFLQCSKRHKDAVFEMLRSQRNICFRGGLQSSLVDDHFITNVQSLHISELWLACDTDAALPAFREACGKLVKAGFGRDKIRCYSLIGHDMEKEEARNREIWNCGAMPFSQLQRDFTRKKTEYSKEWRDFERSWQRPAIMRARMKEGGSAETRMD